MEKKLIVGAAVVFITPQRERVNALVEVVHASAPSAEEHKRVHGSWPCINVLFLSPDPTKKDVYGPQKERASSVTHGSSQGIPRGYCWLWPEEADAMPPLDNELKPNG